MKRTTMKTKTKTSGSTKLPMAKTSRHRQESGKMRSIPMKKSPKSSSFSQLSSGIRMQIIDQNPKLIDQCDPKTIEWYHWYTLVYNHPELAPKCPHWNTFDGINMVRLLCKHPSLAETISVPWQNISMFSWVSLLGSHPQFADKCNWSLISPFYKTRLIMERPELFEKCPVDDFTGHDWARLLTHFRYPVRFSTKCQWKRLDGGDIASLLRKHPRFAKNCDMSKLSDYHWSYLLKKRPELASYRK